MNPKNLCKGVYLDNSATSRFKPRGVIKAVKNQLKYPANPGRGGHCASINAGLVLEEAREQIKRITGEGNVILTKNCTEALNIILFGLKLKGEVITSVFDHNSVLRPLYKLESDGKIKLKFVKPAGNTITAKEVTKLITTDTSMIIINEMSNLTGARHEIEEIGKAARAKGILFGIDAAQSVGHTNADYQDASFIVASGHKGLHGPQGTGFLYFKEGLKPAPLLYGGTGTMGLSATQPESPPDGYESGTANTPGAAGLAEGIKWTLKNKEKIHKKIAYLSEMLIEGLREIKGVTIYTDNLNGVVSFNLFKIPSTDISAKLDADYHIAVRSGLHCAPLAHRHLGTLQQGAIRASIGCDNSEDDIERLLTALHTLKNDMK